MSIKAIAQELYRAQQNVERLEKEIEVVPSSEKDGLREELRQARAEWQILRKMLDGEKETSSFRKKFQGFGQKQ